MIVKIAKPIDDCAQLLVLLFECFDLFGQFVYLVNQFLGVLDLPLLLVQEQLEHDFVVLVGLLIVGIAVDG